jgi:hypothetical protein
MQDIGRFLIERVAQIPSQAPHIFPTIRSLFAIRVTDLGVWMIDLRGGGEVRQGEWQPAGISA